MQYEYIETKSAFESFCSKLTESSYISYDTEFVSEDSYYPELCLIQVATETQLAVIDTKEIQDSTLFFEALATAGHRTIVHAGREEFRYCRRATNSRPSDLFDIQLAAAFVGLEYPASYGKLIWKILDLRLPKGETRTDWRRRPLTDRQIEYALQDVIHLKDIHDVLLGKMKDLGRVEWFFEEMDAWQANVEETDQRERWRRVSGITGLPEKCLVIVRELWRWREAEAKRRNRPPKRVLRDDLIVELAKRGKAEEKQIRAIRGIDRSAAKHNIKDIAEAIRVALAIPKSEWPKNTQAPPSQQSNLLGQFISTALSCICRASQLAPNVVGTVQDVRDLVTYRLFPDKQLFEEPPALATGWRAEVVGHQIDDLLAGKKVIRISDPMSDNPITLEDQT